MFVGKGAVLDRFHLILDLYRSLGAACGIDDGQTLRFAMDMSTQNHHAIIDVNGNVMPIHLFDAEYGNFNSLADDEIGKGLFCSALQFCQILIFDTIADHFDGGFFRQVLGIENQIVAERIAPVAIEIILDESRPLLIAFTDQNPCQIGIEPLALGPAFDPIFEGSDDAVPGKTLSIPLSRS